MTKTTKIKKEKAAVDPSPQKCKFGGFCYPHKSKGKDVCSKCEGEITPKKIAWQRGEKMRRRRAEIKRNKEAKKEDEE